MIKAENYGKITENSLKNRKILSPRFARRWEGASGFAGQRGGFSQFFLMTRRFLADPHPFGHALNGYYWLGIAKLNISDGDNLNSIFTKIIIFRSINPWTPKHEN